MIVEWDKTNGNKDYNMCHYYNICHQSHTCGKNYLYHILSNELIVTFGAQNA
jgi:hypothetical protein